ncbi:MAG TPA: magnesium-translocating P-type ATPase, partial [Anaerolineales bacterium]
QERKEVSGLGLFLNQFKSPIILILLLATLVSIAVGDTLDAVIILAIVLGSAVLSFIQEYGANNAAEKLRSQLTLKTSVLRDGVEQSIPTEQVVPGDVVSLSAGSLIPADGVVLEARDFFLSQAVLTGETFPVEKKPGPVDAAAALAGRTNTVFMGTSVRSGSAKVLIVETGSRTVFGQLAKRLSLRPPETEFERGIRHLGYLLTQVMFVLVLAIFATNVFFHKPVLDSLLFSIALAVGLTPQLLPAIININLSRGSQAMAARGVIVRRLESIENFGSMDILCTDKTGTVTEGVVRLDKALDPQGNPAQTVLRYAYLNAHFQTGLSNPLDEAIVAAYPKDDPAVQQVQKADEIPYDFIRKRLSVVVCEPDGQKECAVTRMVTKGALKNILEVCSRVQQDGQAVPLDATQSERIQGCFTEWSGQGFRVLGVATREMPEQPSVAQHRTYQTADEQDMTFAGFLLFFDPPKAGVKDTIAGLAKLGVELKIITGDNMLVAQYTAQMVGLEQAKILTGSEIEKMRDEALWHTAEKVNIFAEVDPNEKERIILALKKTGHVVGYMGDGINDAPSLHSADVGISVANAVDVAKEAADFVLLKQDLAVLEQGIVEGRKTFANTLKYVFMATSANFGNMFSVAGASLFLPFLPMLPKQILLINFLTDLPEMTIAGDNVDDTFITKPHRWDVGFIRRFMLVFGTLSSVFDYITFGVLLLVLHAGPEQFRTGWFVESVLSAGVVVFALRTRLPFLRSAPSRAMLAVTALVALATLALPFTPLAGILGFQPLPVYFLVAVFAIVIVYFVSAELAKRWFFGHFMP